MSEYKAGHRSTPPTSLTDARILDELQSHPIHWMSLVAHGGKAAIRCIDCGFKVEGDYQKVVTEWNAHLPVTVGPNK